MINESTEIYPMLAKIVAAYEKKVEYIPETIKHFKAAQTAVENAGCIGGYSVDSVFSTAPKLTEGNIRFALLRSAWKYTYNCLYIHSVASAKDRKELEFMMMNPPSFTLVNIKKQFNHYILNSKSKEM